MYPNTLNFWFQIIIVLNCFSRGFSQIFLKKIWEVQMLSNDILIILFN